VAAALEAVIALGTPESANAPACTLVSAVAAGSDVVIGWVGDSRAYWLADADSCCLTTDDSWAERMVAAGELDAATAFADPRSHALVGWIGADAGEVVPHVRTFTPPGPGVLLVCTDGLWNYRWEASALASAALPDALTEPLPAAAALTKIALDEGGHDNITVVLVPRPHPTSRSIES
jgi:serine/threonine protein phosphatase PrpC